MNLTKTQLNEILFLIPDLTGPQLVENFNNIGGTSIKKFQTKAVGQKKLKELIETALLELPDDTEKEEKKPVDDSSKVKAKTPYTIAKEGNKLIKSLVADLKEKYTDVSIRKWDLKNPETGKAFQNGDTHDGVENTHRERIHLKEKGTKVQITISFSLDGTKMYKSGLEITNDDLISIIEDLRKTEEK